VNDIGLDLRRSLKSPKIHKTACFGVQGHPRSLNSTAIESQCTTTY